jgi:hypothetical protein
MSRAALPCTKLPEGKHVYSRRHLIASRRENLALRRTCRSRKPRVETSDRDVCQLSQGANACGLKVAQLGLEMGSRTRTEERLPNFMAIAPNRLTTEPWIPCTCPTFYGVHKVVSRLQEFVEEGRGRLL